MPALTPPTLAAVDEAAEILTEPAPLAAVLQTLRQVELGYLQLSQRSIQLSGGEAQRPKPAATLMRGSRSKRPGLVLLDEPVTGLHPDDVQRLVDTFYAILDEGSTVINAEHDLHVAAADWVIDLGPGRGDAGGRVCGEGRTRDGGHRRRTDCPLSQQAVCALSVLCVEPAGRRASVLVQTLGFALPCVLAQPDGADPRSASCDFMSSGGRAPRVGPGPIKRTSRLCQRCRA